MEVFLIPVGAHRYELYCEMPDEEDHQGTAGEESGRRGFRRLVGRFREALAEVERERHQPALEAPATVFERARRWVLRRIAETLAEQRLLWHLRRRHDATALYPDDLQEEPARTLVRTILRSDFDKHRRWLVIDAVLLVLSGALAIVPGPNVIAYYLAFRVVGHYFSMRGARQGLDGVTWRLEPSAPLSELRQAIGLAPEQRAARVTDIAARLRLERLTTFFQRTAVPSSS